MKTKPGFNIRNVCGQDLIVAEGEENIDFSNIISMNETSSYIWKQVQQMDNMTLDDMTGIILKEYDADLETAHDDCEKLAAQWGNVGIIEGEDIPKVDVSELQTSVQNNSQATQVDVHDNQSEPKKRSFFGKLFHRN